MLSIPNFLSQHGANPRALLRNFDPSDSRQVSMTVAGAAMVLTGAIFRRSLLTLGLTIGGAAMIYKALGGKFSSHRSTAVARAGTNLQNAEGVPGNQGCKVVRSVRIDAPAREIFRFVRNLENAPQYLRGIESVQILDDHRSHWTARTPTGATTEWYLEVINEHPNEMIAWQSLEASDVHHAGSIRFEGCADGSTEVKVALEFQIEGLGFEQKVAEVLGQAPENQLVENLSRLKFLVETGAEQIRIADIDPDAL